MNSQRIHAVDITARKLKSNAHLSLKDQQLRNNMRSAMDSLISKRIISMPDEDERENLRLDEIENRTKTLAIHITDVLVFKNTLINQRQLFGLFQRPFK